MKRAALALLLLSGCAIESARYKSYPPNPFPDIEVVAVLPFLNRSLEPGADPLEFANLFASELLKFDGFRVIRPLQILEALGPGARNVTLPELLRAARSFRAQALIVGEITDYDPYDPPKIGLSIQFLRTSARAMTGGDIDRLVASASWKRGPVRLSREEAGHHVAAFEDLYDAHEERIRREIVAYAQAQDESDSPFPGEKEFMAVQARYMQFVSNQAINHLFELVIPAYAP